MFIAMSPLQEKIVNVKQVQSGPVKKGKGNVNSDWQSQFKSNQVKLFLFMPSQVKSS